MVVLLVCTFSVLLPYPFYHNFPFCTFYIISSYLSVSFSLLLNTLVCFHSIWIEFSIMQWFPFYSLSFIISSYYPTLSLIFSLPSHFFLFSYLLSVEFFLSLSLSLSPFQDTKESTGFAFHNKPIVRYPYLLALSLSLSLTELFISPFLVKLGSSFLTKEIRKFRIAGVIFTFCVEWIMSWWVIECLGFIIECEWTKWGPSCDPTIVQIVCLSVVKTQIGKVKSQIGILI